MTSKKVIYSTKGKQIDENVYYTDEDIPDQFLKYFLKVIPYSFTSDSEQLLMIFLKSNNRMKIMGLMALINSQKMQFTWQKKLNLKCSTGLNGLTSRLHKTFTDEFCSILAKNFNHFVQGEKLPSNFLAIVKLLPKSENATAVQIVRPIGLMNTDAKICPCNL